MSKLLHLDAQGASPPPTFAPQPSANSWKAVALSLVVEIRVCSRCHASYRTPGLLRVRMEGLVAGNLRTWYIPHKDVQISSFLRHERVEVETPVRVCEGCFKSTPLGQGELFPHLHTVQPAISPRLNVTNLPVERPSKASLGKLGDKLPKKKTFMSLSEF